MPARSLRFRSVFTLRSLSIYRAHTRYSEGETKGCAFTGRKKRESKFKNNHMLLLIRVERRRTHSAAIHCIWAWWRRLYAGWHCPRCATGVKWGKRHCHSLCFYSPRTKPWQQFSHQIREQASPQSLCISFFSICIGSEITNKPHITVKRHKISHWYQHPNKKWIKSWFLNILQNMY